MSAAARLLERLKRVKQNGPGRWLAGCPAHEDRSPSLSIRELEDGRVLLHDFGGCETGDVLAALGLALSDLFDRPLEPAGPSRYRIPTRDARELLEEISLETSVIADVASTVLGHRTVTPADWARFRQAARRIHQARDQVAQKLGPRA